MLFLQAPKSKQKSVGNQTEHTFQSDEEFDTPVMPHLPLAFEDAPKDGNGVTKVTNEDSVFKETETPISEKTGDTIFSNWFGIVITKLVFLFNISFHSHFSRRIVEIPHRRENSAKNPERGCFCIYFIRNGKRLFPGIFTDS